MLAQMLAQMLGRLRPALEMQACFKVCISLYFILSLITLENI